MFEEGIKHIWETHSDFQIDVLTGILKNIRGVSEECIPNILDYLKNIGAFYIPYDEYLLEHFNEAIADFNYGIYIHKSCKLVYRLAIPLRLMNNKIIGFVGYTNENDFNANGILIKYLYPPKEIFAKGKYFFVEPDEFRKAINDGYVCLVDGIFDKITLQANGINAISLCGSSFTHYHLMYLKLIKHVVIIADNDDAGNSLAYSIKRRIPSAVRILQPYTKDIDEYMANPKAIKNIKDIIELMKKEGFSVDHKIKAGVYHNG